MSSCSNNGMSALVALLTVGSQNEDINKNPQVSLFVYSHLRHTHFSQVIHVMNNSSGSNSLSCGEQSFTFTRNGDLLNAPYFRFDLPGIANGVCVKADSFQFPNDYFNGLTGWTNGTEIKSFWKFKSDGELDLHSADAADDVLVNGIAGNAPAYIDDVKTYHGITEAPTVLQVILFFMNLKAATHNIPINANSGLSWDPSVRAICPDSSLCPLPSVSGTATAKYLETGDCLQLFEKNAERVRAHVEKLKSTENENALTYLGPEPYWAWGVGYALAECMTLCMGNQQIDRSYGHWMSMWEELTDSTSNSTDNSLYAHTQGEYSSVIHPNTACNFKTSVENRKRLSKTQSTVYVPVNLGWARTAATSMPLVACTFNTVTVSLRPANLTDLIMNYGPELECRAGVAKDWISDNNNVTISGVSMTLDNLLVDSTVKTYVIDACGSKFGSFGACSDPQHSYNIQTKETPILKNTVKQGDAQVRLLANYVFLQQGERQKFAEGSHEQIIVQTQRQCERVSGCSMNVNSCSFHHPVFGTYASLKADPKTVGVNREPLDSNSSNDAVNLSVRPAITHLNVSLNNAQVLPSSYDCELARYADANCYNTMFRGADSTIQNGSAAVMFCTDAMRALIQPCGTVNFSRVDEVCYSFRISPEMVKANEEKDHSLRQKAGGDAIAKSISAAPVSQMIIYASNYNVIRYQAGMAGCKWAL